MERRPTPPPPLTMQLRPDRTMSKKTARKPSPSPMRFAGMTDGTFHYDDLAALFNLRTSKELAGLLRERGIGIPKDKAQMIDRLIAWARRSDGMFILTIS